MSKTKIRRSAASSGLVFLAVVFALALTAATTLAQSATGEIVGKVTDPNGAVVTGAVVSVKSVDTGRELTATSDDQGSYTIPSLHRNL